MNRKTYNKLIRDKIPEIIETDNATPKVRKLSSEEFSKALKEKLVEEAKELVGADSKKEVLNELSDILELVRAIAENNGLAFKKVEKKRREKKKTRGGFEKKLFLEYVDE